MATVLRRLGLIGAALIVIVGAVACTALAAAEHFYTLRAIFGVLMCLGGLGGLYGFLRYVPPGPTIPILLALQIVANLAGYQSWFCS